MGSIGRWIVLAGLVAAPSAASAEPCGTAGVTRDGSCVDEVTLAFCDDTRDETVVVPCPSGEICAELADRPGFYLCVDPAQTPCADIPLSGKCTTDNATLFCHEGKALLTPCPDETICTLNPDTGEPECISEVLYEDAGTPSAAADEGLGEGAGAEDAGGGSQAEPPPDASSTPTPDVGPAGPGASPTVEPGPAYTAQGGGQAGCGLSRPGHRLVPGAALLLMALTGPWLRRRSR